MCLAHVLILSVLAVSTALPLFVLLASGISNARPIDDRSCP